MLEWKGEIIFDVGSKGYNLMGSNGIDVGRSTRVGWGARLPGIGPELRSQPIVALRNGTWLAAVPKTIKGVTCLTGTMAVADRAIFSL